MNQTGSIAAQEATDEGLCDIESIVSGLVQNDTLRNVKSIGGFGMAHLHKKRALITNRNLRAGSEIDRPEKRPVIKAVSS
jgi:hypothetical protein